MSKHIAIAMPPAETKQDEAEAAADPDQNWAICCSKSSAQFIKYMVQVVVSLTILVFAIAMVSTGHDDSVYWSLITLIIGVFVPSPSLTKRI